MGDGRTGQNGTVSQEEEEGDEEEDWGREGEREGEGREDLAFHGVSECSAG